MFRFIIVIIETLVTIHEDIWRLLESFLSVVKVEESMGTAAGVAAGGGGVRMHVKGSSGVSYTLTPLLIHKYV